MERLHGLSIITRQFTTAVCGISFTEVKLTGKVSDHLKVTGVFGIESGFHPDNELINIRDGGKVQFSYDGKVFYIRDIVQKTLKGIRRGTSLLVTQQSLKNLNFLIRPNNPITVKSANGIPLMTITNIEPKDSGNNAG